MIRTVMPSPIRSIAVCALALLLTAATAQAQRTGGGAAAGALPTIEEKTSGFQRMDGLLPLYWDAELGQLWMEIPRLDTEMIHYVGYGAGLGSNDLGLDRGALRGSRIVKFERVGRKVLMVQPNYDFRANSTNPDEVRAVRDAFARSVLWGFTAEAATGDRVLVDLTGFLMRDPVNAGGSMRPGQYRLDAASVEAALGELVGSRAVKALMQRRGRILELATAAPRN